MSVTYRFPVDAHSRYLVEIKSLVVGVFKEAHGLVSEREVIEIEQGGSEYAQKKLGPYAQGSFILREGETDDLELWNWHEASVDGGVFASGRRSGAVILVNGAGDEIARWKFRAAAVTEWSGPVEKPTAGKAYEIEALEVTHEGLEIVVR